MLDPLLDIFWLGKGVGVATRTKQALTGLRADVDYLDAVRRGLLPLPTDVRAEAASPFGPPRRVSLPGLAGRRLGIATTGGSGATACLLGVLRACEEADVVPSSLVVCSGSALFGFPWAAGIPADTVAELLLGLGPKDLADPDWRRLALLGPTLGRGFGGVVRGDAVEASFRRLLGDMTLSELKVPCYSPAWNVERNRLVYLGPETYPDLPVARAVRASIALPLFFAPVEIDGGWWCDGGVVDVFPVRPLLEHGDPPDVALAVNAFWPAGLEGEARPRWREEAFSLLGIEAQVRTANHIQHSRDNLARLREACPVVLAEPVPYDVISGAGLSRQYVDNRQWPSFMRAGLDHGREALREAERLAGGDAAAG